MSGRTAGFGRSAMATVRTHFNPNGPGAPFPSRARVTFSQRIIRLIVKITRGNGVQGMGCRHPRQDPMYILMSSGVGLILLLLPQGGLSLLDISERGPACPALKPNTFMSDIARSLIQELLTAGPTLLIAHPIPRLQVIPSYTASKKAIERAFTFTTRGNPCW